MSSAECQEKKNQGLWGCSWMLLCSATEDACLQNVRDYESFVSAN